MSPSFRFRGTLPTSKSMMLRGLIIQSYASQSLLPTTEELPCEDVALMKKGLQALDGNEPIDCGASAAVIRFLATKASRLSGHFTFTGIPRLFDRPFQPLLEAFRQLGVSGSIKKNAGALHLIVESQGWKKVDQRILIDRSHSSQFASAIVLNAWNLPYSLDMRWSGEMVSDPYFQLTLRMAQEAGMRMISSSEQVSIPANQSVTSDRVDTETDVSSAFSIAALAGVAGKATILDFPQDTFQADRRFVDLLHEMGVHISQNDSTLSVHQADKLLPISRSLRDAPDLFPVLSVLCGITSGTSNLYGAKHLRWKESNRIEKCASLLRCMNRRCDVQNDGLVIYGKPVTEEDHRRSPRSFDPENDHRMAMAAAVAKKAGFAIQIKTPDVVRKSFPEFWKVSNVTP